MNIAVVYSVPTRRALSGSTLATEEDTVTTARSVSETLSKRGENVALVPVSQDSIEMTLRAVQADCIVNLIDWSGQDLPLMEEAMKLLEELHIPYTGATRETLFNLSDKIGMKNILSKAGLPVAAWQQFHTPDEALHTRLHFPVIVKLAREHCSIGLDRTSIATSPLDLQMLIARRIEEYCQPVFAEEFLGGREFQVTVIEREHGPSVLPPSEIHYRLGAAATFLTFSSRWSDDGRDAVSSYIRIADLTPALLSELTQICRETWRVCSLTDYARVDLRMRDDSTFLVLEANANPGLSTDVETDCAITLSYQAIGMNFSDFLGGIISSCLRRGRRAHTGAR